MGAHQREEGMKVEEVVLEATDIAAPSGGSAAPTQIACVGSIARVGQGAGQPGVTP